MRSAPEYSIDTLWASERHLPNVWISVSAIPMLAAQFAASLLKLCPFQAPLPRPAMILSFCRVRTTCSHVNGRCSRCPMQKRGAYLGQWLSIVLNCFMAAIGHPTSLVAAIVS